MVVRLDVQLVESNAYLGGGVAVFCQVGSQQFFLDIAVSFTVNPVPKVAIAKKLLIAKKRDDPVLGDSFTFSYSSHI